MTKKLLPFLLVLIIGTTLFSQEALVIADLHFNPFYPVYRTQLTEEEKSLENERTLNKGEKQFIQMLIKKSLDPSKTNDLNDRRLNQFYNDWNKLFAKTRGESFAGYKNIGYTNITVGENTDGKLFDSMLSDIKKMDFSFDCVLYMGDFLTHGFDDSRYNGPVLNFIAETYGEGRKNDIIKQLKYSTILYVLQGIRRSCGNKPIYCTLGNSDLYLGKNYSIDYKAGFTGDITKVFDFYAGIGNTLSHWEEFTGAYTTDIKSGTFGDIKLLSINTNYFYLKDGGEKIDSSELEKRKALAEKAMEKIKKELENVGDKKVWIIMHIPPGQQVSLFDKSKKWEPIKYWFGTLTDEFTGLYREYADKITLSMSGHTHKSEFKIVSSDVSTAASGVTLINPGVGMRSGNFPGYTYLKQDSSAGNIITWQVYAITGVRTRTSADYMWKKFSEGKISRDAKGEAIKEILWTYTKSSGSETVSYTFFSGGRPSEKPDFELWWKLYNVGSVMDKNREKAVTILFDSPNISNDKRTVLLGEYEFPISGETEEKQAEDSKIPEKYWKSIYLESGQ